MSTKSGLAERFAFVPDFGFRPDHTLVLGEPRGVTVDQTTLTITAAAAGQERTEVLFEWEPPENPDPNSWVLRIDRSGTHVAPSAELEVALVAGGEVHAALSTEHRFRSASGYELREVVFPGVAADLREADLRVAHAGQEWRVPFTLVAADFPGRPDPTQTEREGITVAVTAIARRDDEIAVGLEARTNHAKAHVWQMGSGGPSPFPVKLQRPPRKVIADPLVVRDDQGRRSEEVRRLRHISRIADEGVSDPWPMRITSTFLLPDAKSRGLLLTVPSVMIGEQTDQVIVDLRTLPTEIRLGAHRLHVVTTEVSPKNPPRTRIVFQLSEPPGARHFLGPSSLLAQGLPTDMSFRGEPDDRQVMWMDTIIPDAPIVTLAGGLVRVDGPWTLALSENHEL